MEFSYNGVVKTLMKQIEAYRKANGIEKQDMAELLGAPTYQHYYMWRKRDSIPKAYVDRARAILAQDGQVSKQEAEILEKFSKLSDQEADMVLRMIEGILSRPDSD